MRVEVLRSSHLSELRLQSSQQHETARADWHAIGARCVAAGNAFAVRDDIGRVIFCGGAIEHHAQYASLWGRFGSDKPRVPVWLTRTIRRFVADLPQVRVDASVSAGNAGACGWLMLIGLEPEAVLRGADPDGGDLLIYRRRMG